VTCLEPRGRRERVVAPLSSLQNPSRRVFPPPSPPSKPDGTAKQRAPPRAEQPTFILCDNCIPLGFETISKPTAGRAPLTTPAADHVQFQKRHLFTNSPTFLVARTASISLLRRITAPRRCFRLTVCSLRPSTHEWSVHLDKLTSSFIGSVTSFQVLDPSHQ
jgi:hypothetical protein